MELMEFTLALNEISEEIMKNSSAMTEIAKGTKKDSYRDVS